MNVELGYALDEAASPGLNREALERLDRRHVAPAHERISDGMAADTFGYRALDLCDQVDLDSIEEAVADLPATETVLVVGMGGSALGARTLAAALAPDRDWYVLDTLDPRYLQRVIESIDLERTAVHVVSKSGTTVETRAIFAWLTDTMDAAGVDWASRTIATTGADGPLGRTVETAGATRLEPPAGVPGRYSVLSSMALPSAAALGIDLDGLLEGASAGRDSLAPSLFACPAYAYGAAMAALANRGVVQNAVVAYEEALTPLVQWFCQLWAESLGKDGLGQTPIPGRGVADHHSQLQRWRGGRHDLAVTTLASALPAGPRVDLEETPVDIGDLGDLERRAMEASLEAAGVPAVRLELGEVDAATLGELFVTLEAATMLVAELWDIDAFDQPAVDWAKAAVRAELGLAAGSRPPLSPTEALQITPERRG